jgi:F-type H+-transporting ATPase subunit delta
MTTSVYAKLYAKAIFNIAVKKNEFRKWQCDLRTLACLSRDAILTGWLQDPTVDCEQKVKVITDRCPLLDPVATRIVCVLAKQGQLDILVDIAEGYRRLVDRYLGVEGVEDAEVISAIPLDNEDKLLIAQRLTEIFGKPVVLKPKVDPTIIGGLIIKIGDELIDGSIRGKLEALKRELVSG